MLKSKNREKNLIGLIKWGRKNLFDKTYLNFLRVKDTTWERARSNTKKDDKTIRDLRTKMDIKRNHKTLRVLKQEIKAKNVDNQIKILTTKKRTKNNKAGNK